MGMQVELLIKKRMVLIQSNSAQDFESLVRLHQWRQAENTWVLWKTRTKKLRKQADIALILSAFNQPTNKEFSVALEIFRTQTSLRNVILNIEISNDNSCAGSPPRNSNSDNSSLEWNFGKIEFKHPTSVSGQTVLKSGTGTLWPTTFQRSFYRFLKLSLL